MAVEIDPTYGPMALSALLSDDIGGWKREYCGYPPLAVSSYCGRSIMDMIGICFGRGRWKPGRCNCEVPS